MPGPAIWWTPSRRTRTAWPSSRPLPLGRYKIVESKAADFYGLDQNAHRGGDRVCGPDRQGGHDQQEPCIPTSAIKKTGYVEVMPGQQIRYDFQRHRQQLHHQPYLVTTGATPCPPRRCGWTRSSPAPTTLPGNYKVVYKTNLNAPTTGPCTDNLSTQQNYVLDASPAALGLASNEVCHRVYGRVRRRARQLPAGGDPAGRTAMWSPGSPAAASSSIRRMWAASMTASGSWPPPGG